MPVAAPFTAQHPDAHTSGSATKDVEADPQDLLVSFHVFGADPQV